MEMTRPVVGGTCATPGTVPPGESWKLGPAGRRGTCSSGIVHAGWREPTAMRARTARRQLPLAAAALFTTTLLLSPQGKGASPEDFHANIVNGRPTSGFPAAGALLIGEDPAGAVTWCSGVLIGCETFLTAAHCVCDTNGAACQGARSPSPLGRVVYLQHAGFFRAASIRVHPDYQFPQADLAIIRLATPVTGVAPAALAQTAPPPGTSGTIVGFGRSGGGANDLGLKRSGTITTAPCTDGISDATALCWNYTGSGANSCNGDSGGPLFVDSGFGTVVAGIASGGRSESCLPGDFTFDSSIAPYRAWIEAESGADLGQTTCGGVPQAGDPRTTVVQANATLGDTVPAGTHTVDVPAGTNELRVALNAIDDGQANFDLYVKAGRPPTADDYDCRVAAGGQYAYCQFNFPVPGTWYLMVTRAMGSGPYQLTASVFGGDPPVCGNGVRETGELCDGADDGACPGACNETCACGLPCLDGGLVPLKLRLGHPFLAQALLLNPSGAYDRLDPRTTDFSVTLDDGAAPVEITIPAGDRGWIRSSTRSGGAYRWTGRVAGAHAVILKCRSTRSRDWRITVKGADGLEALRRAR